MNDLAYSQPWDGETPGIEAVLLVVRTSNGRLPAVMRLCAAHDQAAAIAELEAAFRQLFAGTGTRFPVYVFTLAQMGEFACP